MSLVYSYLRFSSARQATGTSIDRQLEYARRWAADNGMALDESLTMRDEGLSAFHGRHIKSGALGVFLAAIDAGAIPAGSVLIIEGLDRLSRAEPLQAQAILTQIINADITVVTAADGKRYNRESIKLNPMDLVYSLLVMIRANEESETKSKRGKAALRKHCETWIETGKMRGAPTGRFPEWMRWTGSAWELIPERVEGIRLALTMFRQGHGHVRIAGALLDAGLTMTRSAPNSQQLYRIVRNPAIAGIRLVTLDGETYRLRNYYPALVTEAEFDALQVMMAHRAMTAGASTGKITGVVTGSGITFCGYCGAPMVAMNKMGRRREDNTIPDGARRIICSSRSMRKPCPHPNGPSVVPIERAVMRFCANQLNLDSLFGDGDRAAGYRAAAAAARRKATEIEQQLERVTAALLAAEDGASPLFFVRKARDLETELAEARKAAQSADREAAAVTTAPSPGAADAWQALATGVESLDEEARLMARQLLRDTFSRIAIFASGFIPDNNDGTIGLVLVGKGGGSRVLVIDRKTGEWAASEDFTEAR